MISYKNLLLPFNAVAETIRGKVKAEKPGLKTFFNILGTWYRTIKYKTCDKRTNPSSKG